MAQEAHRLDPALVPAACLIARHQVANDLPRKALKLLRETWNLYKHPDLADIAARAIPGDGPEARYERVRDLVGRTDDNIESACALAKAAIPARRLDVAREALAPFVAERPQARVCALMGEIEDAAGDKGKSREWFARAVSAPRDPMWVSDGVASPRWRPVSPVTGEIVPCEWKVPFDVLPLAQIEAPVESQPGLPDTKSLAAPGEAAAPIAFQRPPDDPGVEKDANQDG
ncbi:MAG: hypothetical protein U1E15_05500 [Hyphomicrobiales bacterium]